MTAHGEHMNIRPETPEDFPAIYDFVAEAFKTARVSSGTEQDYVDILRRSGGYVPGLGLVAEEQGRLIGHILLTETRIRDGAREHTTLLLAPLAVLLSHRGRGLGATLVRESSDRARELGYGSIFLVGDPAYYGRFGFRVSSDFGIDNAHGVPAQYVLGRELRPGALEHVGGTLTWPDPGQG